MSETDAAQPEERGVAAEDEVAEAGDGAEAAESEIVEGEADPEESADSVAETEVAGVAEVAEVAEVEADESVAEVAEIAEVEADAEVEAVESVAEVDEIESVAEVEAAESVAEVDEIESVAEPVADSPAVEEAEAGPASISGAEVESEPEPEHEPAPKAEPAPEPEPEPEPRAKPRKRFRKTKITSLVLAVLLVLTLGGGTWYVHATIRDSFPQTAGALHVPGLDAAVEVDRDAQGVPQLYARTAHDLFFAQGFVQAQDRFWQMDVYRHITAGRLSEMFGKDEVDTDTFIRTMGWRNVAEQEYASLTDETKAGLTAYADGVNAYLADHHGSSASVEYAILGLQTDYTPYAWTPVDSIAWLKALAWDLRDNMQQEIDRSLSAQILSPAQVDQLFPAYPDGHPAIVQQGAVVHGSFDQDASASTVTAPFPSDAGEGAPALARLSQLIQHLPAQLTPDVQGVGSNSWVVSGALTATGKPLLANDPHLAPQLPSIWYQMGLHCTTVDDSCPYDVAGFTMPGTPGVLIGHTKTIAWGFTNGTEDVADLVLEKVTGNTYLYDGEQLPLETRQETVKVAGGKDVTVTIRSTNQGPLVSEAGDDDVTRVGWGAPLAAADSPAAPPRGTGYAVALRWTALMPNHTADALFEVDKATNWDDFRAAARDFAVPSQNMIYADTSGNIGYQTPGQIPIRKAGDGTRPVPGWVDTYEWQGFVPFDELPHALNPDAGFVVTANNPIIDPKQYPYLLSEDFDYGYRANEITKRLQAATADGAKIDAAGMRAIQADDRNEFAATLVPVLKAVPNLSPAAAKARTLFDGWDYGTPAESAAAAYFYETWKYLLKDAFASKLPDTVDVDGGDRWFAVVGKLLADPDDAADPWWDDPATEAHETRDELLARAMDQAAKELSDKYGGDPKHWKWGDLHKLTPANQTLGTGGPFFVKWLLNGDPTPVAGGSAIVDATGFDIAKGFAVDEVPSMRMLVDLSDLDRSTWVNLTGASGHVDDPHYLDQLPLWRDQKTLPWGFSRAAVLAGTKDKLMLNP